MSFLDSNTKDEINVPRPASEHKENLSTNIVVPPPVSVLVHSTCMLLKCIAKQL